MFFAQESESDASSLFLFQGDRAVKIEVQILVMLLQHVLEQELVRLERCPRLAVNVCGKQLKSSFVKLFPVDCNQGPWNASLAFAHLVTISSRKDCRLKSARSSMIGVGSGSEASSGSMSACSPVTPRAISCRCLCLCASLCQSCILTLSSRRFSRTRAAWRCLRCCVQVLNNEASVDKTADRSLL